MAASPRQQEAEAEAPAAAAACEQLAAAPSDAAAAAAADAAAAEVAAAPRPERWMPASWLAGPQGAGSLLLSLGAVTGGGLLGSGFDLQGPGSVLQALGVLGLTVGIHEAGHFLAAVTRGIHVTKFSIGFGPTLLKWQGKEVEYSLRALPLGGFVAFPDDDPESPYARAWRRGGVGTAGGAGRAGGWPLGRRAQAGCACGAGGWRLRPRLRGRQLTAAPAPVLSPDPQLTTPTCCATAPSATALQ